MPLRHSLSFTFLLISQLVSPLGMDADAAVPERESTLVVYGDDACPQPAHENEAIVCARRPESERYRVPRRIRERQQTDTSWGSRVEGIEEASAPMRPNSCSVVGSFGQSGCTQAMIRQWYAERRARRAEDANVP